MNVHSRLWLFIYSTPNIIGTVLGLCGLTLYFTGVIKSFWPFIVTGLYLAGYMIWPRSKQLHLQMSNELQEAQIFNELEELMKKIDRRLPEEMRSKVHSITQQIGELLPRVGDDPQHRHILIQTATDYLPRMLEYYLNLPVTFARFHPMKNGKTARQILLDQLTLLDNQLQNIALDLHQGDADALMAHSRFLQDKFSNDQSWIS